MEENEELELLQKRIMEDGDFINWPRLGNSLIRLMEKNPDGVDDEKIGKVLLMSKEEVEKWYNSAINKLRKALKVRSSG